MSKGSASIIKVKDLMKMEVPEIIRETTRASAEALTGILKSQPLDLYVSLGHIAQRLIAGQKLDSVRIEWEKLREKGRIKKGYERSMQAKYTLLELLRFLETDIPDEDRFQILKRILLVAATEEKSTRDSVKPQQFMQIVKGLSSGCAIVLIATYRLSKNPPLESNRNGHGSEGEWLQVVAKESGLEYPELVANYEQILMDKRLITERVFSDGSGVKLMPYFRLTTLGYELCCFIDHYETLKIK